MLTPLLSLTTSQLAVIGIAVAWDLVWKGIALWRSAENKQMGWFIACLLINSIGILPIVYLTWFRKDQQQ